MLKKRDNVKNTPAKIAEFFKMYFRRKARAVIRTAPSNPNFEFMGFEHLTQYNDEHPDELHKAVLARKHHREMVAENLKRQEFAKQMQRIKQRTLIEPKRGRGRQRGDTGTCSRCRYSGHNRATCTKTRDIFNNKIRD